MSVLDIVTLVPKNKNKKTKTVLFALTLGIMGCMVFHLLSLSAKSYLMPFYTGRNF